MNIGEKKYFFSEVDQAIKRVWGKLKTLRALFIYDKEGQITIFQHVDEAFAYNESELGQVNLLPTFLSQIFESLQEQISKVKLGENDSVSVVYDKYTLKQFKIGDNLRSTILAEGEGEAAMIDSFIQELRANFGHIDAAVSEES